MMDEYRNSQLSMRRSCGYAYMKTYVDMDPGLPSPSLQGGGNIHRAVSDAVMRIVRGDLFMNVHEIAYQNCTGDSEMFADVVAVLTKFQESLEEDFSIDAKAVFLLEEKISMPLTLPDGTVVTFYGTPDMASRVEKTTVEITDWKTHWHPETQSEFEADPQLKRYALLLSHLYPNISTFRLTKRFIRYWGNHRTITLKRHQLEGVRIDLISEIVAERAQRAAGNFEATGGSWCAVCTHHASCPRIRLYREQGVDDLSIPDDDRARQLAGDAIALAAAANRIKEQVRVYLSAHPRGYVHVPGGTYGFASATEREVSLPKLRKALQSSGADLPDTVLKVDLDELTKLQRRLPAAIADVIDKTVHVRETARCQFRRGNPEATTTSTPDIEPGEFF